MTNEEVIKVLNKINPFNDNSKMQEYFESVEIAINSIQENTKLKAEIEQLKKQRETRIKVSEANFNIYSKLEIERDNLVAEIEQLKEDSKIIAKELVAQLRINTKLCEEIAELKRFTPKHCETCDYEDVNPKIKPCKDCCFWSNWKMKEVLNEQMY